MKIEGRNQASSRAFIRTGERLRNPRRVARGAAGGRADVVLAASGAALEIGIEHAHRLVTVGVWGA